MAAVRIVESRTLPWMTQDGPRDDYGEPRMIEVAEPDGRGAARYPHPGSDTELYLHEAHIPPDTETKVHAHQTDEIIYVLGGEMHLGARVLGPGDSIFIPGMTLYGFHSGPDGLHFLNFRGRRDRSHITKERLVADRGGA